MRISRIILCLHLTDDVCDGLGPAATTQCQQTMVDGRYRFAVENLDGSAHGQLKMSVNGYLSAKDRQPGGWFM